VRCLCVILHTSAAPSETGLAGWWWPPTAVPQAPLHPGPEAARVNPWCAFSGPRGSPSVACSGAGGQQSAGCRNTCGRGDTLTEILGMGCPMPTLDPRRGCPACRCNGRISDGLRRSKPQPGEVGGQNGVRTLPRNGARGRPKVEGTSPLLVGGTTRRRRAAPGKFEVNILPGMNAGASTYTVPSPIEGSGTAWVLLGSWALSPARPTPIHPRHECRGFSAFFGEKTRGLGAQK
jgi:hypothetical protein